MRIEKLIYVRGLRKGLNMKIQLIEISGWSGAIRGMRSPMNSWHLSDSTSYALGITDLALLLKLTKAGSEHRKTLRMIHVQAEFTLPIYIWSEFDTYKVGVTRNSCSTMHKLGSRDLTCDDFQDGNIHKSLLEELNIIGANRRDKTSSSELKNKLLRMAKQILPSGYLQSAVIDANYEVFLNMYHQRKNHRLLEWSGLDGICEWIQELPYMEQLIKETTKANHD